MSSQLQWMLTTTGQKASFLLVWNWQALVLLICVWLGLKIFRVRTPAIRHNVWLMGLLAIVITPFLGAAAERLRLPSVLPSSAFQMLRIERGPSQKLVVNEPTIQLAQKIIVSQSPSLAKPILSAAFVCLWLIGVILAIAKIINQIIKLRRICRAASLTTLSDLDCSDLGPRRARIGLSPDIQTPITTGVLNPIILLPADFLSWTNAEERRAVLRHEMAHIERGDLAVNVLINIIGALFFFHPMVRFASKRLGLEREIACDDRVVNAGTDPANYAESLYKVAKRCILSPRTPGAAHGLAILSTREILERRIEMILNEDRVRSVAKQWRYLLFSALLIVGVAWLLIPTPTTKPGFAQVPERRMVGRLMEFPNYFRMSTPEVLNHALTAPEKTNRWSASSELLRRRTEESNQAVAKLYDNTDDQTIKQWIIDKHAERSEMESLVRIAYAEPTDERRAAALRSIKWLKQISDDERIKSWDLSAFQNQLDRLTPAPPPVGVMMASISDGPRKFPPEDGVLVGVLLREMADARLLRDSSFFEKTLTEDFQQTSSSGRTLNKTQTIAEMMNPKYELRKITLDESLIAHDDGYQLSAAYLVTETTRVNGVDREAQHQYTVTITREEPDTTIKISSIKIAQKAL
jgi:beta-lactamase regulating signal transducer with metallopeptidase domain